uniref:Reverse transcriptase domain-containing protein n=1 Tax=Nicotiana tabacum TaxID=4097 RepID=A0A1S3X5J8_TOBAC|nr:PREDICTED: uncharacterized protein LOC107761549 [Nicotiana tabacum]
MTKSYDRLSWLFFTKVQRKIEFGERFIGLVFGIVSNNWYSALINGQPYGFIKSSRGVKQGDPLSPRLFILAAEALSRGLNALHLNLYFGGYGMPKWSPKINHLAYADDTIIFSSSDATSLRLVMEVLTVYEAASSQLVNKSKSALYMHHLADVEVVTKVERITGIGRKEFPFTYLGCPIFYARRKMDYYQDLITKVMDKLQAWKGKLLSNGGRAILISHVLQSMPIHLLSAVNPPHYVINKIHKIFAQFFWSSTIRGNSRHWASWNSLCMPCDEGGIGFRSLHDVSRALFCKLWWNFKTKPSLWSSFMCQKYCKKLNAIIVPWRKESHTWRKMLECRDVIEHQITWQLKMGSSLFWFDNWTGLGALYFLVPPNFFIDETIHNVYEVLEEGAWNVEEIMEILPEEFAVHMIWRKLSLQLWRTLWMYHTGCSRLVAAKIVWKYFLSRAGIRLEGLTLHQAITSCWTVQVLPRIKPIMQALPSCIIWELWKRRNSFKYGEVVSISMVIYQVSSSLQALVRVRKPGLINVHHKWQDMLTMLENYTLRLKYDKVIWELPMVRWVKVNTNGASRVNLGRSSIGLCIRNDDGDLVYALGREINCHGPEFPTSGAVTAPTRRS